MYICIEERSKDIALLKSGKEGMINFMVNKRLEGFTGDDKRTED